MVRHETLSIGVLDVMDDMHVPLFYNTTAGDVAMIHAFAGKFVKDA